MMYLNPPNAANQPLRVNLTELRLVREHYMPAHAVRFARLRELRRVAAEVSRQHPQLREEAQFVLHEELHRRRHLAGDVLRIA